MTSTRRRAASTASPQGLAARLAGQTPEQRLGTLTGMVTAATAAVLGHPDPGALDSGRPFKDLGIDSLTALELRNTLSAQTGLSLPATLVFDHPTPTRPGHHLAGLLGGSGQPAVPVTRIAARTEEPVAVVGMACRFPGGVGFGGGVVGSGGRRGRTRWARSPRIGAGTSRSCSTPTRMRRAKPIRAVGGFLDDAAGLMPIFSGSPRVRRWRWIRSSGCCWRWRGRP